MHVLLAVVNLSPHVTWSAKARIFSGVRCLRRACGRLQDEHPSLPEAISGDMQDFLLACFQKDPTRRPGAAALLRHRWVRHHRATLRASWSRTAGLKARGGRTDAHVCVSAVVERILQARARRHAQGFRVCGADVGGCSAAGCRAQAVLGRRVPLQKQGSSFLCLHLASGRVQAQFSTPLQVEADDAAAGRSGMEEGGARAAGGLPGGIADSATEMGLARSSAHSSASAGSAVAVDIPPRGALARPLLERQALLRCSPGQRGCGDANSIMLATSPCIMQTDLDSENISF